MRKPRDYDSQLKALDDKARLLRAARLTQLGMLVVTTGADTLSIEELAGALLSAAGTKDAAIRDAWQTGGTAFFHNQKRGPAGKADRIANGNQAHNGSAASSAGDAQPR